MNLTFWLYIADLIVRTYSIFDFIFGGFVLFICILILLTTFGTDDKDIQTFTESMWKKIYKKLWLIILFLLLFIAIPSKKTIYLMLGSSYLSSNNLPIKIQQALELKLDDVIKDLKGKNDKK
jgi:hypothetical protein